MHNKSTLPHLPLALPSVDQTPIRPPRPLPEHILLQLPRTRLRQLLHYLHLPRHHKPADAALMLRPFNHILDFQVLAGLDGDECFGALTPVGVGYGYYGGFEDIGVGC